MATNLDAVMRQMTSEIAEAEARGDEGRVDDLLRRKQGVLRQAYAGGWELFTVPECDNRCDWLGGFEEEMLEFEELVAETIDECVALLETE
jgi:hypothetical protein